jgi:phage-related protein
MEFDVQFYKTMTGESPVREFLLDMCNRDPDEYSKILSEITQLRDRLFHRAPYSKPIGDGLFELRHRGRLNTRLIYFFVVGRRIIMVHGIRNKAQDIPRQDRHIALERMKDWIRRHEK